MPLLESIPISGSDQFTGGGDRSSWPFPQTPSLAPNYITGAGLLFPKHPPSLMLPSAHNPNGYSSVKEWLNAEAWGCTPLTQAMPAAKSSALSESTCMPSLAFRSLVDIRTGGSAGAHPTSRSGSLTPSTANHPSATPSPRGSSNSLDSLAPSLTEFEYDTALFGPSTPKLHPAEVPSGHVPPLNGLPASLPSPPRFSAVSLLRPGQGPDRAPPSLPEAPCSYAPPTLPQTWGNKIHLLTGAATLLDSVCAAASKRRRGGAPPLLPPKCPKLYADE